LALLAMLRFGQGIALGGSWDGLPSLLALNAPQHKRGWYAMLGQLGAPTGFIVAAGLFSFLLANLSSEDFLDWGWRYPFYVAFAINVVALFARLRLVSTNEYARLLEERELQPTDVGELVKSQGRNVVIGALAALASYALFHLVTVFPLSWITLYSERSVSEFLVIQIAGAVIAAACIVASGWIADRIGRRRTLGSLAILIGVFSGFVPLLMQGGDLGQTVFIAALTSDLAWLVGAAFAPLVALGLSAHFGLAYVSLYLLSGAAGSLAALSLNRALEIKD
jgi:MFS family permease